MYKFKLYINGLCQGPAYVFIFAPNSRPLLGKEQDIPPHIVVTLNPAVDYYSNLLDSISVTLIYPAIL